MMKQGLAKGLGLAALVLTWPATAGLSLLPQPQHVELGQGSYRLDAHTGIDAPADARGQEVAGFLRDAVAAQTGIALDRHGHGITLELDPSVHGDEAYRLTVTADGVTIQAASERGLFWGVQTLRQLLPDGQVTVAALPVVRIDDAPAYAYRGFMLDVGRHFYPVSFIEKQLDLLSYYKFNVFHWHLTDDQGWRLQVPRYPKLTDVGAWRTEADGSRYGGFYSEAQVREVIDYARQRNIMVIPEIEMPGHSVAALSAYPALSCTHQPMKVATTWGVFKDIDCVGDPQVFSFLENVLDEVVALFPSPYIHIGGDETPKDRWKTCASCQALMHQQGLKNEEGLQSYFIQQIQRYLQAKGKTLIGWDEILEGGANQQAVIEIWRGDDEARKALANGNRIIVAGPFYLDAPLDRLTVKGVYQTDIAGSSHDAVFAAHRAQILGGEAPLWSERANPLNAPSKMYPRLLAMSENLWRGDAHADADFADFLPRLAAQETWLSTQGVAYGPEDRPVVRYSVTADTQQGGWQVHAQRGFDDLHIHYSTDGSTPSLRSPAFDDDVHVMQAGTLKLVPFRGALPYDQPLAFTLVDNLALGASIRFAQPSSPPYADGSVLIDGVLGDTDFNDGRWAAWHDEDLDATIDLGKPTAFQHIDTTFLLDPESRILLPANVRFSISSDGKQWTPVYQTKPTAVGDASAQKVDIGFQAKTPLTARYVRVEATRVQAALPGFVGGAHDIWLFVDELLIR